MASNDETFLREEDMWYRLPDWADDSEGADGFEWRMYWLVGDMAGNEACAAIAAKGEAERQFHQFREQLLDRLMRQIEKRLPPHSSFAPTPSHQEPASE